MNVYQRSTDVTRAGVNPYNLEMYKFGRSEARIGPMKARIERQLVCGHWTCSPKDSYSSKKHGVDMFFCHECSCQKNGNKYEPLWDMSELRHDQKIAVDALVVMLQKLGFKIEKP